ncbi:MAG: dynamin family protein [Gammaproteobacteria bacterium]|nr:dynamin family protein [Gammaproteobacteria bacterium]
MAVINVLSRRLAHYRDWRDDLIRSVSEYQSWAEQHGLGSAEDDLRIYELIDSLKSDRLTVALVGELSRGKTALINAIFFSDSKRQLLPSDAGRTTMCPTELLFDDRLPPCLRLLPIETRSSPLTIAELRRTPLQWTTLPLDLESPKSMAATLQEIMKTKTVSLHEARELGFFRAQGERDAMQAHAAGKADIPIWRHAIVNYPHPLLKQGLVILDTPGLNSVGTEPELTLSLLPNAQAVMFVVAADTGVTKSDLAVWNGQVQVGTGPGRSRCLAVLNKIDTLWDELRGAEAIADTITRQALETARALGISQSRVFPVSAQKGLLAKIKGDNSLNERSGLPALEVNLAEDLVPSREAYLRDQVAREIGDMVRGTEALVSTRLADTDDQLGELRSLGGKSRDVIQALATRLKAEKAAFDSKQQKFLSARAVLSDQVGILVEYLSLENFDRLIAQTRRGMRDSWTTHGIKTGMDSFFRRTAELMDKVNGQVHQIKGLLDAIYRNLDAGPGIARLKPVGFSLLPYRSELQRLQDEAEAFRNSPVMLMTEQHFVINKFFITLVSRARGIFEQCNGGAKAWGKSVMTPMMTRIREHRMLMEQRLRNLDRVRDNLENLGDRIAELEAARKTLQEQLHTIRAMLAKLSPKPDPHDGHQTGNEATPAARTHHATCGSASGGS